jgi:endonuclease YncB( thermonuclease family)
VVARPWATCLSGVSTLMRPCGLRRLSDLGFEVIRRQRIRLARIDAPDRDTPEGARGRRSVREQLAVARAVIVNTRQTDLHGRYVAHLFYAFNNRGIEHTFTNGRYLNQELVNKGFAKVV